MSVGHTLTMEYIECSSEGKKKKKDYHKKDYKGMSR